MQPASYAYSLVRRVRLPTRTVLIGDVPVGSRHPVRIQSMTTTDTMDTKGTADQVERMVASGCEYVRITAPSTADAENLKNIRDELRRRGCKVPLIADIHFTPNAAEIAARIVEKVRVNPGNYADRKAFKQIEYTDAEYRGEIERIRERFLPLVKVCKQYGTAMRLGANHGSLSDRILSRYGDTPEGMVESALEFLSICEDEGYFQVVLSMKASNTQVMVQAYRLLARKMLERGRLYPLHLGVTEAGEGEEGRIKSATGIGALLLDGLGDTVRVSLTEDPEFEAPVARRIVDHYENERADSALGEFRPFWDPYVFRRAGASVAGRLGEGEPPVVIASVPTTDAAGLALANWKTVGEDTFVQEDRAADFIHVSAGSPAASTLTGLSRTVGALADVEVWKTLPDKETRFPVFPTLASFIGIGTGSAGAARHDKLNFIRVDRAEAFAAGNLVLPDSAALILDTDEEDRTRTLRAMIQKLRDRGSDRPVLVVFRPEADAIDAACVYGPLLVEGLVDGFFTEAAPERVALAFQLLQASRLRLSKTEYISCPSCGRTQFHLQQVSAKIRARTGHLKGVKIAIMGCIVNGPGEMADADFGYVGTGPGRISLYKGHTVVERNVPEDVAVDKLVDLLRQHGKWREAEPV